MKYTVQNLARRPVSIICNNGKALHLPPKFGCEVEKTTVSDNAMVEKLIRKHLIAVNPVRHSAKNQTGSTAKAKTLGAKPAPKKTAGKKKTK